MPTPNQHQAAGPAPSAAEFSAAMAALGAYAQPPTADELKQQAKAVGGEHVLAAVLANALYGAAVGAGMLAEGHMTARGAGGKEMSLARQQVLKALGADALGVMGALHWQAGHVWQLLKELDKNDCGPVIAAAARTASALLALLACSSVFSPEDERAVAEIPGHLNRAQRELAEAMAELEELPATAAAMFLGAVPGL
ncbi:DUF6245 family protein [Streptomyces rimosus]|uniref:DUF6245 family protein n=1 Tax=Streptomyces rimosus TaxID=1927 RepID=UPI00131AA020|nr:DUF6245 family protein [Streptomyces rimosus]